LRGAGTVLRKRRGEMYTASEYVRESLRAAASERFRELAEDALKKALRSPILLQEYEAEMGRRLEFHLVQTPQLAIKVFCMSPQQPKSPPHDHAGLWGLYGTYRGVLYMSFYEEIPGSTPESPRLREGPPLRIGAGQVQFVPPEAIHAVWTDTEGTIVLTVYNGDLNNSIRRIFDLQRHVVVRDLSRWEERLTQGGGKEYAL
jgi:predicted metal-dependent enzyme (double-stranded beta helix superfamily)